MTKLKRILEKNYPEIQVKEVYSPSFRPVTEEGDNEIICHMNNDSPDFI